MSATNVVPTHITSTRGDDDVFTFSYPSGVSALTGKTVQFAAATQLGVMPVLQKDSATGNVTFSDSNQVVSVPISGAESSALSAATYTHDLRITTTGSVDTLAYGLWRLRNNVGGGGGAITPSPTAAEQTAIAIAAFTPYRVRTVATTNVVLATGAHDGGTIAGTIVHTTNIILLTGQTAPTENGPYICEVSGPPTRDPAFTGATLPGVLFLATGGDNAETLWRCTNATAITFGVTSITFAGVGGGDAVITDASVADVAAELTATVLAPVMLPEIVGTLNGVVDSLTTDSYAAIRALLDATGGSAIAGHAAIRLPKRIKITQPIVLDKPFHALLGDPTQTEIDTAFSGPAIVVHDATHTFITLGTLSGWGVTGAGAPMRFGASLPHVDLSQEYNLSMLLPVATTLTIAAFIQPVSLPASTYYGRVFGSGEKIGDTLYRGIELYYGHDGELRLYWGGTAYTSATGKVSAGVTAYVMLTYDNGELRVYVGTPGMTTGLAVISQSLTPGPVPMLPAGCEAFTLGPRPRGPGGVKAADDITTNIPGECWIYSFHVSDTVRQPAAFTAPTTAHTADLNTLYLTNGVKVGPFLYGVSGNRGSIIPSYCLPTWATEDIQLGGVVLENLIVYGYGGASGFHFHDMIGAKLKNLAFSSTLRGFTFSGSTYGNIGNTFNGQCYSHAWMLCAGASQMANSWTNVRVIGGGWVFFADGPVGGPCVNFLVGGSTTTYGYLRVKISSDLVFIASQIDDENAAPDAEYCVVVDDTASVAFVKTQLVSARAGRSLVETWGNANVQMFNPSYLLPADAPEVIQVHGTSRFPSGVFQPVDLLKLLTGTGIPVTLTPQYVVWTDEDGMHAPGLSSGNITIDGADGDDGDVLTTDGAGAVSLQPTPKALYLNPATATVEDVVDALIAGRLMNASWVPSQVAQIFAWVPAPSRCWQDAARTIPAGVGDPVGSIRSQYGTPASEIYITPQYITAAGSARPILRQDVGGRYYLEADGAATALTLAAYPLGGTGLTLAFAGSLSAAGSYPCMATYGATIQELRFSDATRQPQASTAGTNATSATALTLGDLHVILGRWASSSGGTLEIQVDGASEDTDVTVADVTSPQTLAFLARGGTSLFLQGKAYALAVAPLLSDPDTALLTTWLGDRVGLTI